MTKLRSILGAFCCLAVLVSSTASAQTAEEDSVLKRSRPDFEPIGMELDQLMWMAGLLDEGAARDRSTGLASFLVFPKLDVTTAYESNLFRDRSRQHDRILVVSPELALRSDWERHNLEIVVGADIGRHLRNDTEDYEDVRGAVTGRLDVSEPVSVTAGAHVARRHQTRGTVLLDGRTGAAITYRESGFRLLGEYTGDAFRGLAEFSVNGTTYDSSAGVDNSDLDRVLTRLRVRGSYELVPGTSFFVQPSVNDRAHDRKRDFNGRLQDSNGWEMLAGVTWDVSGVTFAEFGAGYLRQSFDDPAFETVSGPSVSGKLIWNPADLWTLTGEIRRTIQETKQAGFAGVLATHFAARVDFDMRDDTILSLKGAHTIEDYQGGNRTDNRFGVEFEARHFVNRYFFLRFIAGYDKLNSEQVGGGFNNARTALTLGARI